MNIHKIKYSRTYKGDTWMINGGNDDYLQLNSINLIVGQNATGKSNTLHTIFQLANLLANKLDLQKLVYNTAEYDVFFRDQSDEIHFVLKYVDGKVTDEKLFLNGELRIDRQNGKIFYESLNQMVDTQTEDFMLLSSRRDSVQFPYLDKLFNWGSRISEYKFGSLMGKNRGIKDLNIDFDKDIDKDLAFLDGESAIVSYIIGKRKIDSFEKQIVADLKTIGYDIKSIDVKKPKRDGLGGKVISVQENHLKSYTDQLEMSQGMYRALSLILQFEYSIKLGLPSCILIDDIGEGLDYERSQALIKLIVDRAENTNLQVIMTTNDRFVMNSVDLKYWHIIGRSSGSTRFYNIKNSPDTFQTFYMMGLNNFEFFQSKYYEGINILNEQ